MAKYKLMTGTHMVRVNRGGGVRLMKHTPGDIIESDTDLVKRFGSKFLRVEPDDPVKATAPKALNDGGTPVGDVTDDDDQPTGDDDGKPDDAGDGTPEASTGRRTTGTASQFTAEKMPRGNKWQVKDPNGKVIADGLAKKDAEEFAQQASKKK